MARGLFLTGATGYVGQHLLRRLDTARYERIYALRRRPTLEEPPVARNFQFISGDLLDPGSYREALACCDTVVHLAAATGNHKPATFFDVNREGTRVLVEECDKRGVTSFLFVSTIAVKFSQARAYFYAQSKRQAEEIVRSSRLRYTILRPAIILGRQAPVLQGLVSLTRAPFVPLLGGGRARVEPIYVEDLVDCIRSLLDQGRFQNQTLDIGGPESLTMKDFLVRIGRIYHGRAPLLLHLPAGLVIGPVALLERVFPWMPVRAGQLASFVYDGTAEPNTFLHHHRSRMIGVEQALRAGIAA
jgi:NADH dehydrogenase